MEREFYEAVLVGKQEDYKRILDNNPDVDITWRSFQGDTVLHNAARYHSDLLKRLMTHPKFNMNLKNDLGVTPLMLCIEHGQREMFQNFVLDDSTDFSFAGAEGQALLEKIKK